MIEIKIKTSKRLLAFLLCGGVFLFLGAGIMAEEEFSSDESEVIEEDETKKVEDEEGGKEEEREEKGKEDSKEGDGESESEIANGEAEDEGVEDKKTKNNEDILKDTDKAREDKLKDSENKDENKSEALDLQSDSIGIKMLPVVPLETEDKSSKTEIPDEKKLAVKKGDVLINEIAWMGTENSSNDEWIELKNKTDEKIMLDGWILEAEDGSPRIELSGNVSGGEYFLLERTDDTSVPEVEADQIYTGALGNGGEYLKLKDEEGKEIDGVDASDDWSAGNNSEKLTMERDGRDGWQDSCLPNGTPKEKNSDPDECKPSGDYGRVLINEVLPDPVGSDKEEWIELYNFEDRKISLKGWLIKDKTKEYEFSDQEIEPKEYLILKNKLSLNNSGDRLELVDPKKETTSKIEYGEAPTGRSWARKPDGKYEWTFFVTKGEENKFPIKGQNKNKIIFNEIMSNPEGKDKNFEWIELKNISREIISLEGWQIENGSGKRFSIPNQKIKPGQLKTIVLRDTSTSIRNRDERLKLVDIGENKIDQIFLQGYAKSGVSYSRNNRGDWSWSRISTPGRKNWINVPPKIKIKKSKKAYRDVYVYFDASKTKDANGDKLKYRWDFGDGHRSYLKETKHKYDKKKQYRVTLRVDDGSGQFYKSFKIKVKSYPRREVRITSLVPNPAGKDTGNETIVLENLSSKRINLFGWYLSTGKNKENLVKHPFYDDFVLEPGESKELTNEELCKFTLLNKGGLVVLRYPDLKKAFVVEYNKEKIAEGEAYLLIGEKWGWFGGKAEEVSAMAQAEGANSVNEGTLSWLSVFEDDISQTCQCMKGLMLANWKEKNKIWLRFV